MPSVVFRCPTLMVTQGNILSSVLIPDGTRTLAGGVHPDGTPASPHYAGLFVLSKNDNAIRMQMDLHRHRVVVSDGTPTGCRTDGILVGIPNLTTMLNTGAPAPVRLRTGTDLTNRLAASVTFEGGAFKVIPESISVVTYHYPSAFGATEPTPAGMAAYSAWTPDGGEAIIRIEQIDGSGITQVRLGADEYALIYNWDILRPTLRDFVTAELPACRPGEVISDEDFRWLYELLVPDEGDWDAWLAKVSAHKLPAPEIRCDDSTPAELEAARDAIAKLSKPDLTIVDLIVTPETGGCGCAKWTA